MSLEDILKKENMKNKKLKKETMENMKYSKNIFESDKLDFDIQQCLELENNKKNLITHVKSKEMDVKHYKSINDFNNNLGCTTEECFDKNNKISNNKKFKNERKQKDYIFDDVKLNANNANNTNNTNNANNANNGSNDLFSTLRKNFDVIINFVYIFIISVLLVLSIVNKKEKIYLLEIIIITLIYIFYKIFLAYKK